MREQYLSENGSLPHVPLETECSIYRTSPCATMRNGFRWGAATLGVNAWQREGEDKPRPGACGLGLCWAEREHSDFVLVSDRLIALCDTPRRQDPRDAGIKSKNIINLECV